MNFSNRKVVPSYLGTQPMGMTAAPATQGYTTQLLIGEVKAIIEPDSPKSLTKVYREYNVEVQYREGLGPVTTVMFPNCLIASVFGGQADKLQYTLRADPKPPEGTKTTTGGSKVLLLCVAGSASQALIVGAVRDDDVKDTEGHNLYFEFNGISFSVDKDGQAKLAFRGPTKLDGTLDTDAGASDSKGPTAVELLKNGSFQVSTKDQKQSFLIDHENTLAKLQCGGTSITMKDNAVLIGGATDFMMKGSTYRSAETTLHNQLMAALTALSAQIAAAGAAITAACVPLAVPVIGGTLAAPILLPAGAALTSAVATITQMVTAITSFEAQAPTYLSSVNKND